MIVLWNIFHPALIHSTTKPTSLMMLAVIKTQFSIRIFILLWNRHTIMHLLYAENYKNHLTLDSLALKTVTLLATIILGSLKTYIAGKKWRTAVPVLYSILSILISSQWIRVGLSIPKDLFLHQREGEEILCKIIPLSFFPWCYYNMKWNCHRTIW